MYREREERRSTAQIDSVLVIRDDPMLVKAVIVIINYWERGVSYNTDESQETSVVVRANTLVARSLDYGILNNLRAVLHQFRRIVEF